MLEYGLVGCVTVRMGILASFAQRQETLDVVCVWVREVLLSGTCRYLQELFLRM